MFEPGSPTPSAVGRILQEAKRRGPSGSVPLLAKARALEDPYHAAGVLFFLSGHVKVPLPQALALANEAIEATARVDRDARRADALLHLADALPAWREGDRSPAAIDARRALGDALLAQALRLPPGQGRSNALRGLSETVPLRGPEAPVLLAHALGNSGYALDDARAVVRAWALALGMRLDGGALGEVVAVVAQEQDPQLRAHLLGYVHQQSYKATHGQVPGLAFDAALAVIPTIPESRRMDAFRTLAGLVQEEEELKRLADAAREHLDGDARTRFLGTLGAFADKLKQRDVGTWLTDGARAADAVPEPGPRAVMRANLAKAFARTSLPEAARELVNAAIADVALIADPTERERVAHQVRQAADLANIALPADWPPQGAGADAA